MIELDEREQEDGIIPQDGVSKTEVLQNARLFNQSGVRPSTKFAAFLFESDRYYVVLLAA